MITDMPRMPQSADTSRGPQRHNPLADDIVASKLVGQKSINAHTGKRKSRSFEEDGQDVVDRASSRKILAIARDLAAEENGHQISGKSSASLDAAFAFDSRLAAPEIVEDDGQLESQSNGEEANWIQDEGFPEEDIDPADLATYDSLFPQANQTGVLSDSLDALSSKRPPNVAEPGEPQNGTTQNPRGINLADLILERIAEKEASEAHQSRLTSNRNVQAPPEPNEIPPKIVDVFVKCGQLLSRYRSGPLPKPFKILPTLPAWSDLLNITRPESWTANAVLAATKIFASASAEVAQHYYNTVLLDRVKADIYETKKLNVHLYDALRKSLYKPAAFFKGFLFPLVLDGCTLREAKIISSVLVRISIPVLHSAAALLRLCEIAAEQSTAMTAEHAGASNIFIRVLLEKKYALPYQAVDALVFHFLRFRNLQIGEDDDAGTAQNKKGTKKAADTAKLPVLWHQSLLVFAQRYKNDITEDQREALLDLLLIRGHRDIGPEVRRELLIGREKVDQGPGGETRRGAAQGKPLVGLDGDDTMDDVAS